MIRSRSALPRARHFVLLATIFLLALIHPARAEFVDSPFGFTGPEIFPINSHLSHLRSADVNGDGLMDLVLVNNARSRITFLINQTGQTNAAPLNSRLSRGEVNDLPPGSRFRIESIASEKRIASMLLSDLNGDGRPDLVYYGDPRELAVQYNLGPKGWSVPRLWPVPDGLMNANGLAAGDLNGDGLTDIVLLAESHLYIFYQTSSQTLGEPEKLPFFGAVRAVQVLDIDGDGRDDLLLVNWDSPYPFRFRLQNEQGQIGPELCFASPPIRAFLADDLDGDRKTEVVTVSQFSGRAQIANFHLRPAEPLHGSFLEGQLSLLPLSRTTRARRGAAWVDVNGDSLPDLIVAEAESGELTVYLQNPGGGLAPGRRFPTLAGVTEIRAADWNGDGVMDLLLLSADERQVGVTRWDASGRVPFPSVLPFQGRPLAMAAGRLKEGCDASPVVVAAIVEHENKRFLDLRFPDGKTQSLELSSSFKTNPSSLIFHDINQNGLADLLVLIPYERLKILVQTPEGEFEEQDHILPGGSMELPWVTTADVDGDGKLELMVPQRNFLRAVVLSREPGLGGEQGGPPKLIVKEQINGASSSSRIVAAAAVPKPGATIPSLFLLDADRRSITLCDRDEHGVWQVVRNVRVPSTDFHAMRAIAWGDAGDPALSLIGRDTVAWMEFSGAAWELLPLDGYETPIRDGRLNDVISGDLNMNGRKDLVFLETARNHVDVVMFQEPHQLVPANRWPVFEERSFRGGRRGDVGEPREALIADVTGDGRNDLIVLVHDRVLVYPQE
jgi:hypothetical protein